MNDPHEALRQVPIFGGLSDEELDKITSISTAVEVAAGELVVREGELASELFVIRVGAVEVVIDLGGGGERVLARLGVGDCFGEMTLIGIQPRSASVRAVEDAVLMSLSNQVFRSLSEWRLPTYTLIILNLARELSRRLRRADHLMAEFFSAEVPRHLEASAQSSPPTQG